MEIKRNIFQSRARMPDMYEPCAVPFTQEDTPGRPLPGSRLHLRREDVRHVRSPNGKRSGTTPPYHEVAKRKAY